MFRFRRKKETRPEIIVFGSSVFFEAKNDRFVSEDTAAADFANSAYELYKSELLLDFRQSYQTYPVNYMLHKVASKLDGRVVREPKTDVKRTGIKKGEKY